MHLWSPHAKSWLIGKDSDAGRDWGQEEKGMTEDEMAGWHHWLDGRESEWTPGVGDGQGGLACCDSWGHKESDRTERLNWTELMHLYFWNLPYYSEQLCNISNRDCSVQKIRILRLRDPRVWIFFPKTFQYCLLFFLLGLEFTAMIIGMPWIMSELLSAQSHQWKMEDAHWHKKNVISFGARET